MKLFEFEAKEILQKYGIATPKGRNIASPQEAQEIARKIGKPVAVKSQILVSGRGKAGGIKFADEAAEAGKLAASLLGSSIKGSTVNSLLIEEKLDIAEQFYASVTVDRQAKSYVVMASTDGGVDIEQTARASPEKIAKHWVDPISGFSKQDAASMLAKFPDIAQDDAAQFAIVIDALYRIAIDYDAELIETNPLVKTASGEFIAADARIIVDDNAIFRHPEFENRDSGSEEHTPREIIAKQQDLAYVDLDGDIGIIGNGAGLVMATLDLVSTFGGRPANFLDVGGGAAANIIKEGVKLVMNKPEVKAVLINILGGITRCDLVAQGVLEALSESPTRKPIAIRMVGTNEEKGTQMLRQAGVHVNSNMEEAVREILAL
ncbi:MAG: ADP-forming succinate--CoA ligase subunit beta [Chloroflexota bacterium]